jgi:hypothetical protein
VVVADQTLTISQSPATEGLGFESITRDEQGNVTLKLNGGPPGIWELQGSSNVVTWSSLAAITNVTGRVQLTVPAASTITNHFFRALLQ